ncbi:uncharacterized protein [Amphiura filiformis]|uniref:uncharacterized protein n=1 Tax=Amphiura filiformis TaxID=82378 RepID=UPI003B226BE0
MAQLKYTKVVACGTVAAVAGLSLATIYLYKRRGARKAEQKKVAAAKALAADKKKNDTSPEACNDCRKDGSNKSGSVNATEKDFVSSQNVASEEALHISSSTNQNCNTGNSANDKPKMVVEEPCIQTSTATFEMAPPAAPRPDPITEDPCVIATSVSSTESAPLPLFVDGAGDSSRYVEEPIVQAVSTPLENGYRDDVGMTNGCGDGQVGEVVCNDVVGSPFQIEGQQPLSFDWASSVEAAEKVPVVTSLASPTCSTHNGSVAGSDLGSEANSEGGSSFDSGRCSGDSTSSNPPSLPDEPTKYQLEFPSKFCGKLIGRMGRNIKQLKEKTKASVLLKEHPFLEETHLVIIEGTQTEIDAALQYIKDRFSKVDVTKQFKPPVMEAPPVPDMSQLPLPEEIINDVYVSSVVSAAHIFVQQPTHPTFMALQGLDTCMANTYNQQVDTVPQLPRPIEVGVICAAPMMQGWYRAQVVEVYPETDECDIRFLDYGGYARIEGYGLRQIRSDFMTLPFQAVECYLINLIPLPGETDYSETARIFVEQVSQNFTSLHAKVKGYSQDGMPLAEVYYTDNERKVHSLNKELVNQGLVSWFEGYSDDISEGYSEMGFPEDTQAAIVPEATDMGQLIQAV